jgi:hypothetical protein
VSLPASCNCPCDVRCSNAKLAQQCVTSGRSRDSGNAVLGGVRTVVCRFSSVTKILNQKRLDHGLFCLFDTCVRTAEYGRQQGSDWGCFIALSSVPCTAEKYVWLSHENRTHCFVSMAAVVTQTRHNFTSYVRTYIACLFFFFRFSSYSFCVSLWLSSVSPFLLHFFLHSTKNLRFNSRKSFSS